jgi:hypothetical protein
MSYVHMAPQHDINPSSQLQNLLPRHTTGPPLRRKISATSSSLRDPRPQTRTTTTHRDTLTRDNMAQAGDDYEEADMQDVGEHYGEGGQIGNGPYYDMSNLDPDLLGDDISPSSQAYAGDVSLQGLTPSKSKRKAVARTKNGKKQVVEVEEASEEEDEEEDEEDEDAEPESEEDDEDKYEEPEPVVSKRTRASLKRKVATPKTSKSTSKASSKGRSSTRKSKSASKKDEILPFHRTRRPPKVIIDARPIARSFEECDEADKKLIVMRDQDKKTWAEIRGVWEAITKQKTGKSTLPNRYE